MITLLDGPLGTELIARGISLDTGAWSATAITDAPDFISEIHAEYVEAGACVHTANTFRTQRRYCGESWRDLTRQAVELARARIQLQAKKRKDSTAPALKLAGSMGPLADCYQPQRSPGYQSEMEHREMADWLAECGCDLIFCETFANSEEAVTAVQQAVKTGLEVWIGLTAGPDARLITPDSMARMAANCEQAGASAVIVGCTPASQSGKFLQAIEAMHLQVDLGVSANAGSQDENLGWCSPDNSQQLEASATHYANLAEQWVEDGAKILGACCGCGPAHINALASRFLS